MESRRMFSIFKKKLKNYFGMFYAWCCELLNFGSCRHHSVKFINHLFVKIIILYKPHLKKVISKNGTKMTLFDILNDLFS
jgi:hypothetical protein